MNKFTVTITVTSSSLAGAITAFREAQTHLWTMNIDPEAIKAECKLNGYEFFMVSEHGQQLTIDDLAFGVAE